MRKWSDLNEPFDSGTESDFGDLSVSRESMKEHLSVKLCSTI
jgi:hypothetical protein